MSAAATHDMSTSARRLAQAVSAGRLDEADAILAAFVDLPADALLPAAELHMRRRRFVHAAALLDRAPCLALHDRLKRNAARNFASLQRHRPADYHRLLEARICTRYRLAPVAGNRLTIADYGSGAPLLLTPGRDPVIAVQQTLHKLANRLKDGNAIGLAGVGDGYVLGTLARIAPKLFMDMQQCVHVIEPDLSLLHTCFMLHDYSGPQGPIEQQRFQWFIGEDWEERYRQAMQSDLMLPQPSAVVQQSTQRKTIGAAIQDVADTITRLDARLRAENEAYYAGIDRNRLAGFGPGTPTRKPRVLLLTSRFTTVLQYAVRGAADGFRAIGWDARILIEPTQHHQISRCTMRDAVASFKPDLVFQIDHLRHEHEDAFPPGLPFACWIQDHLPHLTDAAAGRRIGLRDFVLTFASPLFTDTYQYPARQCIDMPMMLTTPRTPRTGPAADRLATAATSPTSPQLVYVSNVSQDPRAIEAKLVKQAPIITRPIIAAAARQMMSLYQAGGCMPNRHEVRGLLDEVCAAIGRPPLEGAFARQLVETLWNPLNIALYRQQALGWVADAAEGLGLTMGIYGRGWDANPRFARFARGVIENGDPLARLTRSAAINLNLEPYTCFTHQRLLDGLVAGGFFLIRDHPGNTLLQQLLNVLEDHFDESVQTADDLRRRAPDALRPMLDDLISRASCVAFAESADPVRQVRCWQRAGVLIRQDISLPHLDEVSFADAGSCRALIQRFIGDEARRQAVVKAQRAGIEKRMSFAAGMWLVVERIRALLADEQITAAAPAGAEAA